MTVDLPLGSPTYLKKFPLRRPEISHVALILLLHLLGQLLALLLVLAALPRQLELTNFQPVEF